jgi:hypothetical protein
MVRPIDLQDNLSKTQAAERMNQIQKAHGEVSQKQAAEAIKARTMAEMEKPTASEQTDMVIIRKEQEKEKKKDDHGRKPSDQDPDEEEQDESSEHLDLKA